MRLKAGRKLDKVDALRLLASLGVGGEGAAVDLEEGAVYLAPAEWEKVRRYFGWSRMARAGEVGGWRFVLAGEPATNPAEGGAAGAGN